MASCTSVATPEGPSSTPSATVTPRPCKGLPRTPRLGRRVYPLDPGRHPVAADLGSSRARGPRSGPPAHLASAQRQRRRSAPP
eukprot:13475034-Heterocapsa_arctica.AAC.1